MSQAGIKVMEPFNSWSYDEQLAFLLSDVKNDYLGLWEIPWLLSRAGLNTVAARRQLGLKLVRDLVLNHGLIPGFIAERGGFDAWPLESAAALARIEHEWSGMAEDPEISDICWFCSNR